MATVINGVTIRDNVGRKVSYNCTFCPTTPYTSTVVFECRTGELVVDFLIETREGETGLLIIQPPGPDCYHETEYLT